MDVTGGKERIRHFLETARPPSLPGGSTTPADVPAEAVAALHRRKTEIYNNMVAAGGLALRPGVESLVRAAADEGIRLAIATTTSLPNVETLLKATLGPARTLFEVIAAGDQVRAKNPAPDVFILALERLALPADVCIAFEDSLNGLASARAAGLATVVTPSLYTSHQTFADAAVVASDLTLLAGPAAGSPSAGSEILASVRRLQSELIT